MLTIEQVREGATTPEKAHDLSIEHWHENRTASPEEQEANRYDPCAEDLCGLCAYQKYERGSRACECCILGVAGERCLCQNSLFQKASCAWDTYRRNHTPENWHEWIMAAGAMEDKLIELKENPPKAKVSTAIPMYELKPLQGARTVGTKSIVMRTASVHKLEFIDLSHPVPSSCWVGLSKRLVEPLTSPILLELDGNGIRIVEKGNE